MFVHTFKLSFFAFLINWVNNLAKNKHRKIICLLDLKLHNHGQTAMYIVHTYIPERIEIAVALLVGKFALQWCTAVQCTGCSSPEKAFCMPFYWLGVPGCPFFSLGIAYPNFLVLVYVLNTMHQVYIRQSNCIVC